MNDDDDHRGNFPLSCIHDLKGAGDGGVMPFLQR